MLQQLNAPRTVTVLRAFHYQGQVIPAGQKAKLPAHFAAEMVGANKCVYDDVVDPSAHPLDVDAAKPKANKGG